MVYLWDKNLGSVPPPKCPGKIMATSKPWIFVNSGAKIKAKVKFTISIMFNLSVIYYVGIYVYYCSIGCVNYGITSTNN